MKKLVLIIIVFVVAFSFQSCTDNTEEILDVKNESNIKVFNVDREKIKRPGNQSGS